MQIKGYIVYHFGITLPFQHLRDDYLRDMQHVGPRLDSEVPLLQI